MGKQRGRRSRFNGSMNAESTVGQNGLIWSVGRSVWCVVRDLSPSAGVPGRNIWFLKSFLIKVERGQGATKRKNKRQGGGGGGGRIYK